MKTSRKVIAIIAQKGGVGKSTITTQLAIILSTFEMKTLVINSDTNQDSVGDVLLNRDDNKIACITVSTKNLRKELRNTSLLEGFDVVLIDGEGSMHEHSKAALDVCDYFAVPILPSQFDLNSYSRYVESVIKPVSEYKNLEGGVFLNQDENDSSSFETREMLEDFIVPVFETSVARSLLLRKSSGLGLGISEYRKHIGTSKNFFSFSKELFQASKVKIKNFTFQEYMERSQLNKINRKGERNAAKLKDIQTRNHPKARTEENNIGI